MEKSRSWPSAHDWKSCIPQKGIEGSNPSFSAIKKPQPFGWGSFFMAEKENGFEEAGLCKAEVKNMPVACFLGRGKSMYILQGC